MNFYAENRYWLNRFIGDFINDNQQFFNNNHIIVSDLKSFTDRLNRHVREDRQEHFHNVIRKFKPVLSNYVLQVQEELVGQSWNPPHEFNKLLVSSLFRKYIKECDPEDQFDINKIQFDLVEVTRSGSRSNKRYFLIACDIADTINFGMSYGTLKVLDAI